MVAGRYRLLLIGGLVTLFLGLLAAFLCVPPALATPSRDVGLATTIDVNTTDDETTPNDGFCSLREAVLGINGCAGQVINLSAVTYVLTDNISIYQGPLSVPASASLAIQVVGGDAVIQGQPGWSNRILSINANAVVAISNVTFRNGNAAGGGGILLNSGSLSLLNCQILSNTATSTGGGILSIGTLVVTNTLVESNTVSGDVSQSPQGGGIYSNGKLTISNSAIVSNTTVEGRGGGVSVDLNASVTILKNVTISGNRAVDGGGVYYASQSLTPGGLSYVTVYSNTATHDGGGIFGAQTLALTGTIVARNVATPTLAQNCSGNVASNGYNLAPADCNFSQAGDKTGNPLLDPLQYNGGPTPTHALTDINPALNQIPLGSGGCGTTITTDQRGVHRPQGGGCDIGAFELEANLPPVAWLPLIQR